MNGGYAIQSDGSGIMKTLVNPVDPTSQGCGFKDFNLAYSLALSSTNSTIYLASLNENSLNGELISQKNPSFTTADLQGTYALSISGSSSLVSAKQLARTIGVAIMTADGHGNISGETTVNSAGLTCNGTLTGTYSVEPNGLGTVHYSGASSTLGCERFNTDISYNLALYQSGSKRVGAFFSSINNDYLFGTMKP